MLWFRRLIWRLEVLFRKEALESELDRELRSHLEAEVRANIREGMSPEAARRKATLDFGGVEKVKEEVRDVRGARPLDDFVQDIRHAARGLRRRPLFAGTAILTLALGIGSHLASDHYQRKADNASTVSGKQSVSHPVPRQNE